jgi:hypothetical protein
VRKVHGPFVGRYIGALGFSTEVAKKTLLDDFVVIGLINTINFQGVGLVDQIEQRWKRITQTDTTAAAVTDVKYALEFGIE